MLSVILCVSLIFGSSFKPPITAKQSSFETNGKDFKIITFTDIHFGTPFDDYSIIQNILDKHNPDFVVLNGDNGNTPKDIISFDGLAALFLANGQKWTATLGNHDRDVGLSLENSHLTSYDDYCVYDSGNLKSEIFEKYGNHAIDITSHGEVIYKLVFLDSGPFYSPNNSSNGYLEEYQVKWYSDLMTQAAIDKYGDFNPDLGHVVPSMVFFHLPLEEEIAACTQAFGSRRRGDVPAEYGWGEIVSDPSGYQQPVNTGLFKAAKQVGGTHIFVGHLHENNGDIKYEDIELVFLTKTGQNNSESLPLARVSFATQILLRADVQTGAYTPDLAFAMQDGSITRDPHAWENLQA